MQPIAPDATVSSPVARRPQSRLPGGISSGPGYAHAIHRLLGRARSRLVGAAVLGIGSPPVPERSIRYMISILITIQKNG